MRNHSYVDKVVCARFRSGRFVDEFLGLLQKFDTVWLPQAQGDTPPISTSENERSVCTRGDVLVRLDLSPSVNKNTPLPRSGSVEGDDDYLAPQPVLEYIYNLCSSLRASTPLQFWCVLADAVATPTLHLVGVLESVGSRSTSSTAPTMTCRWTLIRRQPQANVSPTTASGQLPDHLKQGIVCARDGRRNSRFEGRVLGMVSDVLTLSRSLTVPKRIQGHRAYPSERTHASQAEINVQDRLRTRVP